VELHNPDYVPPLDQKPFDMSNFGFNAQNYRFGQDQHEMFDESIIPDDDM
jgi:hypothetical protein